MNKYKGFLLATAGGVAFVPSAQAADLPLKAAAMPSIATVSWVGYYWGIHAGAANTRGEVRVGGAGYTPDNTAFIGGGQLGYNWQSGNLVYGWEGDISGLAGRKTINTYNTGYLTYRNHIEWLSTIRGRAGLALGRTMVYMTAGLAIGGTDNLMSWSNASCCGGTQSYSGTKTRVGWTVGVGIEHMWDRNWSLGLEALYVDLGDSDGSVPGTDFNQRFSNTALIGRAKANYRF